MRCWYNSFRGTIDTENGPIKLGKVYKFKDSLGHEEVGIVRATIDGHTLISANRIYMNKLCSCEEV